MARYKLVIEYEGSRYHGWQQNTGVRTIQGEMLKACEKSLNTKEIELYAAGRTDAGVHALGQVAHLDIPMLMQPEMLRSKLNERMPYDINILSVEKCSDRFHARHDAVARSYVYVISRNRSAFRKHYVWWVREELSLTAMKDASALFLGFHDFKSFGTTTAEEQSTLVDIQKLEVKESGDRIVVHIIGSHFLWNMVRRVTGVLVHAGKGKLGKDEIRMFLEQSSQRPSQLTAPPSGLYLERIYYPGETINTNPRIPVMF
jgi:tRNA pseudouridine38-40 synthase